MAVHSLHFGGIFQNLAVKQLAEVRAVETGPLENCHPHSLEIFLLFNKLHNCIPVFANYT